MSGTWMGPAPDWERRTKPLLVVVPYGLLAVLAGVTVAAKRDAPGSLLIDLAVCAVMALWILLLYVLRPAWRDRPRVMGVFLGGLIALTFVMVLRDPWFGFFTPACYLYGFRIIGWPAELYFIGATAVTAGTAQASGVPAGTWLGGLEVAAILLVNVAGMCGISWVGRLGERHYAEREAALAERETALAEARQANQRLEAALAENAALQQRLLDQARAAGVLDERQRLAREIHDTLAQGLTGIITQLQAADHVADEPARWRRHHDAATALARESLTEARRSVDELRPEPLEAGRLADALSQVAATWSARYGVAARVTVTGDARPMRPQAEVALLRTAQEALANVAKHAAAGRVGLTLSYMDHEVALDIRDDGRGFDPGGTVRSEGGFGLVAMRQRIEGLAGTLQIESEPGGGTGISACLPADPVAAPA
jgi:signal transduction histidine kinase